MYVYSFQYVIARRAKEHSNITLWHKRRMRAWMLNESENSLFCASVLKITRIKSAAAILN